MKKVLIIFVILVLMGCGVSKSKYEELENQHKQSKEKIAELTKENQALKAELEKVKFGPDRLLKKANNLFADKKYDQSKAAIKTLQQKHPASDEAQQAKDLLVKIEAAVEKQRKEKIAEEKRKIQEQKRRLANATKRMRKTYDKVNKISFYRDRTSPGYNNTNNFQIYFGRRDNGYQWYVLKICYHADDWLFVQKYVISVDGTNYEIKPGFGKVERDNSGGKVWEWFSDVNGDKYMHIVRAVANSKEAILRYEGQKYYHDRTISLREKQALKNVINAYDALKAASGK